MSTLKQIIIAWTEDDVEFVRARRPDLGERPVTRPVTRVKAARWLNEGTEEDVIEARAYAVKTRLEGAKVFAYPQAVSDARGEAIAAMLRDISAELRPSRGGSA